MILLLNTWCQWIPTRSRYVYTFQLIHANPVFYSDIQNLLIRRPTMTDRVPFYCESRETNYWEMIQVLKLKLEIYRLKQIIHQPFPPTEPFNFISREIFTTYFNSYGVREWFRNNSPTTFTEYAWS